jgi:hypothetical protein
MNRLQRNCKTCPHCNADLVASVIPQESRLYYLPFGEPDDGRELLYFRIIGLETEDYDGVSAYRCPDCMVIDVLPGFEPLWKDDVSQIEKIDRL